MRRSSCVVAPILASVAVGLIAGCHTSPEMQRCVDLQNHVVDPALCRTTNASSGAYHYYYGGAGTYVPGTAATEGSAEPVQGHTYSTTNGTARGGFGASFATGGEAGEAGEAAAARAAGAGE